MMKLLILALLASAQLTRGASITLEWSPNPTATPIAGYRLYYGTAPGTYGTTVDLGNVTTTTLPGLTDDRTYYFALSAIDQNQFESRLSTEISAVTTGTGFSVTIGPASRLMPATGGDVTFPITITRRGSTASIFLNATDLPPGSKPARFSSNPIQNSTTMTVTFCSGVLPGSYPFTVIGFGCGGNTPGLTKTATRTLIKAP